MIGHFLNPIFIYGGLMLVLLNCQTPISNNPLQVGDLLFQDLNCGDLCDAIETVTEGVDGRNFSHCGLVVSINDTLKVVEAIGEQVQVNSLRTFFARSGDTSTINNIVIARVKLSHQSLVASATENALQKVGQPYDHEFLLDNGSWYCSELLYDAFKTANGGKDFFELAPMTYKDPATQEYFPAWVDYYEELNKDIPEGKLGLNPGSISRSERIRVIKIDEIKI
ncbi:MAG: YiiX/YebB-like N1pC/P60 family cysteine hydrolase [Bacteroidota bacterium]